MTRKAGGVNTPVVRHKTIHCRQTEIGGVRDGFQSSELHSPCFGTLRHGRRFHVHCRCAISFAESKFLLLSPHGCGNHPGSLSPADFCPGTVGGGDHPARVQKPPDMQRAIQRSGKANRDHPHRAHFPNHRLGCAARGFSPNSATHQRRVAIFKKTITPTAVIDRPGLPAADQRFHLSFHRGDDGDFRHIRYCETNPPTAAALPPLEPSASLVPALLSPNSQTSSCVPCAPRQSSRAARGLEADRSPFHPPLQSPAQKSKAASRWATSNP